MQIDMATKDIMGLACVGKMDSKTWPFDVVDLALNSGCDAETGIVRAVMLIFSACRVSCVLSM